MLTVNDQIEINASKEKVWEVLTHAKYYKQWDELPEDFSEDKLGPGSVIEWEGHSKMSVRKFDPDNHLEISLYLPGVDLREDAYDVSYSFKLSGKNDQTILKIEIGDFSPLPKAQDYYHASVEFAEKAKQKIKELSEQ